MSPGTTLRQCPANLHVLGAGDQTDGLYFILSGRVKIYVSEGAGREFVLNEQGPGECFGEMVLDDGPRSASVLTLEPSRFLVIPRSDVKEFLRRHPDFAMQVIRQLIGHVRRLTEKTRALSLEGVYERLVRYLDECAEEEKGVRIVRGPLTHAELGRHIGASREMVSRVMKDLSTGGYLRSEKGRLVLLREFPRNW